MMKTVLFALVLFFGLAATVSADKLPTSEGVVVQLSGDRADFKSGLMLASNMHAALPKAKFAVVVYGANVKLLTAFSDEAPLLQKVLDEHVIACGRSLTSEHLVDSDLASGVTVVPFGAVHIVNRQKQGWQYIKG